MRKRLYPDAQDYPYGGNSEDEYNGYTADTVIELVKENRWIIYILHGPNNIYSWRPQDAGNNTQHLPIICFNIHDDHAFFYTSKESGSGGAIESISKMNLKQNLPCPPLQKLDICGEDERDAVPTFDTWKMFLPKELYARCTATAEPVKSKKVKDGVEEDPETGFRRGRIKEFFYTHDINTDLEHLQQTRSDKVRQLEQEAAAIFKQGGYATIADVYEGALR